MELSIAKDKLLEELIALLKEQERHKDSISAVKIAYNYAFEQHIKQKRKSGEPYIIHPVAVTKTLIDLKCDTETLCAGLLHDVIEDTNTTDEDLIAIFNKMSFAPDTVIKDKFGDRVSQLVDGVTKLNKLNFKSSAEQQANNFRKMLIAIAKDMRVVLVKLADRLNNMQTLMHLSPEKRVKVARETLEIFAPLANRFGLGAIKAELEDLSFKYLREDDFVKVKEIVSSKRTEREEQLELIKKKIESVMSASGIPTKIQARAKHFYSIYKKISNPTTGKIDEENSEKEIFDLLGVRLIVASVKDCYAALGTIHDLFTPVPGRFKDYIAVPKNNLYQSLHTTVIVPWGKPLEIQIRTDEMHEVAENGIAAHWHYKESGGSHDANSNELEELNWIRQLISWQTDVQDAQEYVDTVKKDILEQEVYILTPKGDVISLPMDSTPVDFAYKIHSKVGDKCTGAMINGKIVPINYKLDNGDVVDIITNKNAHPNLSWLNFVKTNQAKHRIKSWYKKQNHDRHLQIGRSELEAKFGKEGFENFVKSEELAEVSQKLNYKNVEDLLAGIGSGDNTVSQVISRLQNTKYSLSTENKQLANEINKTKVRKAPSKGADAEIPELDGLLYSIAKCCQPIPGDAVAGLVSKGKGITIHGKECHNLRQMEKDRLMDLNWYPRADKTYPTTINIEVVDRVGIVKDLLTLVADAGINVKDFKVKDRTSSSTALLHISLYTTGVEELTKLLNKINSLSDVLYSKRLSAT